MHLFYHHLYFSKWYKLQSLVENQICKLFCTNNFYVIECYKHKCSFTYLKCQATKSAFHVIMKQLSSIICTSHDSTLSHLKGAKNNEPMFHYFNGGNCVWISYHHYIDIQLEKKGCNHVLITCMFLLFLKRTSHIYQIAAVHESCQCSIHVYNSFTILSRI